MLLKAEAAGLLSLARMRKCVRRYPAKRGGASFAPELKNVAASSDVCAGVAKGSQPRPSCNLAAPSSALARSGASSPESLPPVSKKDVHVVSPESGDMREAELKHKLATPKEHEFSEKGDSQKFQQ